MCCMLRIYLDLCDNSLEIFISKFNFYAQHSFKYSNGSSFLQNIP
jgi:hypothetical protein